MDAIEGGTLSDRDVERLLSNLQINAFTTRDEQEVAGYAAVMELVLAPLPGLSVRIVEFVREHGRVTMGDAIRLTGASRNTLKQHFRALVEQGHLKQRGSGRGVWYELA